MGDRGNIAIVQHDLDGSPTGAVFLYTHWRGSDIEGMLARALAKKWRWGDEPYLARIIFDEMTYGVQGHETGFGISTSAVDNEHPVLIVDCSVEGGRVWLSDAESSAQVVAAIEADNAPRLSFEEFVRLHDEFVRLHGEPS